MRKKEKFTARQDAYVCEKRFMTSMENRKELQYDGKFFSTHFSPTYLKEHFQEKRAVKFKKRGFIEKCQVYKYLAW